MRRPPEFIEVTEENLAEIKLRMGREPFIMNGLIYAAGCAPCKLGDRDTVAFPWPDVITELGQLAEDAERELAGEPLPAWPVRRLRLQKGDIVLLRIGVPEAMPPSDTQQYLESCRNVFREAISKAGYGDEVTVLALCDNIEISVIAGAEDA